MTYTDLRTKIAKALGPTSPELRAVVDMYVTNAQMLMLLANLITDAATPKENETRETALLRAENLQRATALVSGMPGHYHQVIDPPDRLVVLLEEVSDRLSYLITNHQAVSGHDSRRETLAKVLNMIRELNTIKRGGTWLTDKHASTVRLLLGLVTDEDGNFMYPQFEKQLGALSDVVKP